MQHKQITFRFWKILFIAFLTACGGGSGGGIGDPNSGDNSISEANNIEPAGRAVLPTSGESNTIGLQLARSSDGALHASYADTQGQVFYARCNSNCGASAAWQSVIIENVDVGLTGYVVPRLELDNFDRPRIAYIAAFRSFGNVNTHIAECDSNCVSKASWNAKAVIGHGSNLLEFRLAQTDWFALDPSGALVMALLIKEDLLDLTQSVRLFSCDSNCTVNANWKGRNVAEYRSALERPVSVEIGSGGQIGLALELQGITANTAVLTWLGCSADCYGNGNWDAISLQTVEVDLNSSPDHTLVLSASGTPTILSYNDTATTSLTLHSCDSNCSQESAWASQDVGSKLKQSNGFDDVGYGIDARYNGNTLEVVYAAKATNSALRQLVVASRCDTNCAAASGIWNSTVIARTEETLANEGICIFLGTRITSSLQVVPGAVGFTASPQWGCNVDPLLESTPEGVMTVDSASDIRYLKISSVATFQID